MLFAVLFEDDDTKSGMRMMHMEDHLAFLQRNAGAIISAGPLSDPQTQSGAGGLWIVRAADAAHARALVEEDPFWPTGLRKSVRIMAWHQVFADGSRLA